MRSRRWASAQQPPWTPLTSAETMRSVQTEASNHDQSRASAPCLAVPGTDDACSCLIPAFPHPSSCPPSLQPVYAVRPSPRRLTPHRGNMRALTPADLTQAGRSLRLLRFAFRASHPHPRRTPECRFDRHPSASNDFQASPYPGRLAVQLRRIGFVSYGLLLRLLLLPTPPHGDAVTLDYARRDFVRQGLSPC